MRCEKPLPIKYGQGGLSSPKQIKRRERLVRRARLFFQRRGLSVRPSK